MYTVFIVSDWHIVGANLPGVHDQFSVGCADSAAQARSSQAHASKASRKLLCESTLFHDSGDIDNVVGEGNEGLICLLRKGYVESRVLNKTDEHDCHRMQLSQKCKSEYRVNHHL